MSYRVVFRKDAVFEMEDASLWYNLQQKGLGEKFMRQLRVILELILQNPFLFPEKKGEYREAPLSIFPFVVVYRMDVEKKRVIILAVYHTKRNPTGKYNR